VWVRHLELVDFRSYERAEIELGPGFTAVVGANGQGKSNLMEAVGYLAMLESFRGVPGVALVRDGCPQAVVRAEVVQTDGRVVTVECELATNGRGRVLVNKQRLRRTSDLLGVVRVTVFSPDDLALVKEGPALRRRFMDQTAVSLQPRADAHRRDLERILKHKSTLLKQAGGRLGEDAAFTLEVWNVKLAEVGERIGRSRAELVAALGPHASRAYADLADGGAAAEVDVRYEPAWRATGLAEALAEARADEVRRQVCLVGPHRDDLELRLHGLPARTHASQGEQRTLALALRLAAHRLVAARVDDPPVLVLDDVFSELDPARSAALLRHLPAGQVLLTTAGPLPAGAAVERTIRVEQGRLTG
jgi:DNA replication and repair protein RecF